ISIMKYASQNDWPALSSVVRPPVIFLVSSDTRIWARATMAGSTPARSRRARSASRPSVSRNSPMSSSDETLEARYSATPVSVSESDRTRNPSMLFSPTSRASDSSSCAACRAERAWKNRWVESSRAAMTAPSVVVVRSTSARRLTPPPPDMRSGIRKTAAKNRGPSSAIPQNDFLRPLSTTSRRTTAHTLRTKGLPFRPRFRPSGLGAYQVDEDLVERRLHQLEPRQPGAGGDEPLQDLLGVRPGRELELGVLPIVVDPLHKPSVCKDLLRTTGTAVEPDDEMVSAMCPLDVAERAVHQLLPSGDDTQLVTQLLGLLHDVRREEDRLPAPAQFEHRILHHLCVHRIEPRERLVPDHAIRIVQHPGDELRLLLHPLPGAVPTAQPPHPL